MDVIASPVCTVLLINYCVGDLLEICSCPQFIYPVYFSWLLLNTHNWATRLLIFPFPARSLVNILLLTLGSDRPAGKGGSRGIVAVRLGSCPGFPVGLVLDCRYDRYLGVRGDGDAIDACTCAVPLRMS